MADTDWDPVTGGARRNTRSSTARNRNQNGTSTKLLEDRMEMSTSTLLSSPRRSRRKKKQKTPETIDILSSDSEDVDEVVAVEEECDVYKVNFIGIIPKGFSLPDLWHGVLIQSDRMICVAI